MPKSVVVFVHGIGTHAGGWAKEVKGTLQAAARDYPAVFSKPLDQYFDVHEVCYNQVFEEVVKDWANLAAELTHAKFPGTEELNSDSYKSKLVDGIDSYSKLLEKVDDPDRFLATHALDAVLYAEFAIVRNIVNLCVGSQIARVVADAYLKAAEERAPPNVIVVGHSLGTAVVQNAVQMLATVDWLKAPARLNRSKGLTEQQLEKVGKDFGLQGSPFAAARWLSSVMMIANVSSLGSFCRPGATDVDSVLQPAFSRPDGVVGDYINVQNVFDPVCKLGLFSTTIWGSSHKRGYAQDVVVSHIHSKDIHGLGHYFLNPSVHARLFWRAVPAFDEELVEEADARVLKGGPDGFPQVGNDLKARFDKELLERLEGRFGELGSLAGAMSKPTAKQTASIFRKLAEILGAPV